jgi:release factor glutamine methyltransferase
MAPGVRIADVGAGSGAIAVTLAVHLSRATVYALDASPEALALAAENAARHGARVRCLAGDLLAPLPGAVDLIVANLPYVTRDEWSALPPEIRDHEPRAALDGGADGLALIGRLLSTARGHLRPGGAVLAEIGAAQGEAAVALARAALPGARVALRQDYAGLDRLIVVQI